jgi:hypothetical protein
MTYDGGTEFIYVDGASRNAAANANGNLIIIGTSTVFTLGEPVVPEIRSTVQTIIVVP